MSFAPATFYVYLECDSHQYLAAFPSRSHADKFWRIVQRLGNGSPGECRRFSPQFLSVPVLPNGLRSNGWDYRSCLVRPIGEHQTIPIIPPDYRPDNINGKMFYIRSAMRPEFYWYFDVNTSKVGVSREHQSLFMIQRAAQLPGRVNAEEDILIGEDDVNISVVLTEGQQQGQRIKIINYGNTLTAAGNGHQWAFKFWLFENGFQGNYEGGEGLVQVAAGPSSGERWEFVG